LAQAVLSFVLASIMSTSASIMAVVLDEAFASKGHFSLRAPLKFVKERFVHTKWKKDYAWRPFLDPLIISLGDQQLVTGYAVLLSGWIKVCQRTLAVQGAHFALILYVGALSSSSHLAALISLRKYHKKHKIIARLRICLVIGFAVVLLSSMISAIAMPLRQPPDGSSGLLEIQNRKIRTLSFLAPMLFILIGFSTALICILVPHRNGLVKPNAYYYLAERTNSVSGPAPIGCNPI
jgi:hypothetical protein